MTSYGIGMSSPRPSPSRIDEIHAHTREKYIDWGIDALIRSRDEKSNLIEERKLLLEMKSNEPGFFGRIFTISAEDDFGIQDYQQKIEVLNQFIEEKIDTPDNPKNSVLTLS